MRKEAKTRKQIDAAGIQGYHSHGWGENYAFAGFSGNWYFNSDRCIALTPNYMRADGQPLQGFGLEIETECNGIYEYRGLAEVFDKIIFPTFKFGKKMFKMQSDGSLGGETSAEVITQIMTKGRIRNDYSAYKVMFDEWFPAFGISADSFSTACGMHVNVSNAVFGKTKEEQEEAIRKLHYLINRYYRLMTRLFYRDPSKTEWCGRMTLERLQYQVSDHNAHNFAWENARNMVLEGDIPSCHGNCLNLSHYPEGRIEIRLVGGQDSYVRFRNTMECVFFLTEKVRKISWEDCEDLVKVFSGCNQYVTKRLYDCVGIGNFSIGQYETILNNVKHEDLELHN